MKNLPPRALFALGVMTPVSLVTFAVILSLFYHVAACPLCIVQRMLYLAIALAFFVGLLASNYIVRIIAALSAAAFSAAGAAIAGYQIYLQHHPFAATCGDGTAWWERIIEQAGQKLPALFKANGLCSDNAWSLWGLSIVEWSLLAFSGFFVLGIVTLLSVRSHWKTR